MISARAFIRSVYVRLFRLTSHHRFRSFGRGIYVFPGVEFAGERSIELGDGVVVLDDCVLTVHDGNGGDSDRLLRIGAGCNIGRRNQIFALNGIEIGRRVITASNVFISDCTHTYTDPEVPIMDQPIIALRRVTIGEGAWIGQNACIIGCCIGRNAVIGANAVVLHDIPDNSVAVGAPAKVIKHLNTGVNSRAVSKTCTGFN